MPNDLSRDEKEVIRRRVFERDGYQCVVCGIGVLWEAGLWQSGHLSHRLGLGAGGDWSDDNLETLCLSHHLISQHNPKSVKAKAPVQS